MAVDDCRKLVDAYVEWLRARISFRDIEGFCEITTPFVDRHNDHLQIYVKKDPSGGLVLTDDGYTIKDLGLGGCEFNTEKRQQMLHSILNGFGIRLHNEELTVNATGTNFPQRKHNLLQAIMAINDLFVMAAPTVASFFREDVERYLRTHQIRFTPSIKFTGKSGFDHYFEFVIPESRKKPERVLSVINRPDRQRITSLIFAWSDIFSARETKSVAYGILNDMDRPVPQDLITALAEYDIKSVLWSQREDFAGELAA